MNWDLAVGDFLFRMVAPFYRRIFRRNAMQNIQNEIFVSRNWAKNVSVVCYHEGKILIASQVTPYQFSICQSREMVPECVGWIRRFATYQI